MSRYFEARNMPSRAAMVSTMAPYWLMKVVRVPPIDTSKRRRERRKENRGVMRPERMQKAKLKGQLEEFVSLSARMRAPQHRSLVASLQF